MKIKKEYPKMMYKKGGPFKINGVGYTYKIVKDEYAKLDLIDDGYYSSPGEAAEIKVQVEKKSHLMDSFAAKPADKPTKTKRGRPKKG